jgi:Zn-dependent protease with chaperone function
LAHGRIMTHPPTGERIRRLRALAGSPAVQLVA